MTSIYRSFVIVLVLILIAINFTYYFTTRDELITNRGEKTELVISNVRSSINTSINIDRYFNYFMAQNLYKSSIAIKHALPPDIKDVTTTKLKVVKEQLGLEDITLFVREGDDIVSVKSSNPNEIGLKTKNWTKGTWYEMFDQLLTNHDVVLTTGFGEALPNFWSGPINTSTSNPSLITKFGYYNDGSTNYLINAILENELVEDFHQLSGVQKDIDKVLETNKFLLSVAVLNGDALFHGEKKINEAGDVRHTDKLIVSGDIRYPLEKDKEYAMQAIEQDKLIRKIVKVGNQKIMKTYFPSEFKTGDKKTDALLIMTTTDYDAIQTELNKRTLKTALVTLLCFIFGVVFIYIMISQIKRKQKMINNAQGLYKQHIDSLFETMKEYRHDFNHHLHTISGLASMGLHSEIDAYVAQLVTIQDDISDLVDVNIPVLSGLIQSKKSEAKQKGIVFEHYFEGLGKTDMNLEKVTDLVTVTGNILDNAFNAVVESKNRSKRVTIYGKYRNGLITIVIGNSGDKIPLSKVDNIFKLEFTTRTELGGTGIGLPSSRKAVERYQGSIDVHSKEDWTAFTIKLPITNKEVHQY